VKPSKEQISRVTCDQEIMENLRFFSSKDQQREEDGLTLNPAVIINSKKLFELLGKASNIPLGLQTLE